MANRSASGHNGRRTTLLAATAMALSIVSGATHASPTYAYQQTLQIPGASPTTPFTGYDLSTIDPGTGLYYLTDRSFNGIDVYSTTTNTFVERIGTGLFAGTQGGNNDIAGPNGISISNVPGGKLLLAGNGTSTVVSFNLDSTGIGVIGSARFTSTAVAGTPVPPNRVDGVAFAPTTNTILAANNASNPGFITLINNTTNAVVRSIPLNGTGGYPNVGGNGVEATIFNTARGTFFVAIPSFNPAGTGAGGVIELDAATGNLLHTYDFNAMGLSGTCSPTGVAQGAGASVFVACSDPTAGKSILLNPTGTGTLTVVPGISGGDQVSYDPTDNTFFEAARFQPGGPVLGIIDPVTLALQTIPIGANDHAVSAYNGTVYVATGATTNIPNCNVGCIGVFTAVPEPATLPVMAFALAGLGLFMRTRRS